MDSFHLTQLFGGAESPRSSLSSGEEEASEGSLQDILMGVINEIRSAIASAKRFLAGEFHHLQSQRDAFDASQKQLWLSFQQAKVHWAESERHAENQFFPESDVRELDVGGQLTLTTTVKMLRRFPESKLSGLAGKDAVYYKGKVFVDRDPQAFREVLRYVRTGRARADMKTHEKEAFLREMEYWEVPLVLDEKPSKCSPEELDPAWCAPTLVMENANTSVRKKQSSHGIVLASRPLSADHTSIEFQVETTTTDRQVKLFLGLVDRSEYTFAYLTSLQWREAPSSFYWNVQSQELVKTDRRGASKILKDYGCSCKAKSPCTLGIVYDPKLQTVCFTHQGISQGTAFTEVPSGLYPAVDLWLETGSVSVVQPSKSESSTETSFYLV